MATPVIKHATVTGAAANPNVLVDGPSWDAAHVVTGLENVQNVDTTNASNITSGTLPAAQLPNPTSSTLGGVRSIAAVSHNWINSISTSGVSTQTQPAFTDISGQATLAQLPTLGANTVLGSIAGGTPIALTATQLTTLVNAFTATVNGAVPNPGTSTNKFLRDDATWATPPGSGTVTNVATAGLATGGAITTTGTITVTAATKSDQQTGSSNVVAVTPLHQQDHASAAKAWAYLTQSAGTYTLQASFNVTSFSKTGTGLVTITFTTAFSTANYASVAGGEQGNTLADIANGGKAASTIGMDIRTASLNSNIDSNFSLLCAGAQ